MRMTDSWKARDEKFNEMYNMFNALTSETPIAYSQGAMHSVGSFLLPVQQSCPTLVFRWVQGTLMGGVPGFAAFGGVGMLQAVGGFARELKDAGFDDDTIAWARQSLLLLLWAQKPSPVAHGHLRRRLKR